MARYLGKDAGEIDRMMEEDGLPFVQLPGPTKPVPRFRLRDVHAWLARKVVGAEPMPFGEFVQEFEEAQKGVNLKG